MICSLLYYLRRGCANHTMLEANDLWYHRMSPASPYAPMAGDMQLSHDGHNSSIDRDRQLERHALSAAQPWRATAPTAGRRRGGAGGQRLERRHGGVGARHIPK